MPSNAHSPSFYDGGGSLGSAAVYGRAALDFADLALSTTNCNFLWIELGDSFTFIMPQFGCRKICDLPAAFDWSGCPAGGIAAFYLGPTGNQDSVFPVNNAAHPTAITFHDSNAYAPANHDGTYITATPGAGAQQTKNHIQTVWKVDMESGVLDTNLSGLGGGQWELFSQVFRVRGTNDAWALKKTGFDADASFALAPITIQPSTGGNFSFWYLADAIDDSVDTVATINVADYPYWRPGQDASYYDAHADNGSVSSPTAGASNAGRIRRIRFQTTPSIVNAQGNLRLNARTADGEPGIIVRTVSLANSNSDLTWGGGMVYVYDDADAGDAPLEGPAFATWGFSSLSISQLFDDSSQAVAASTASVMTDKSFSVQQARDFFFALDQAYDPSRPRFVNINCDVEQHNASTLGAVRQAMYGAWEAQHDSDGAPFTGRTGTSGVIYNLPPPHIVSGRTEAQSHSDFQGLREDVITVIREMEAEGKYVGLISDYDALGGIIFAAAGDTSSAHETAAAAFIAEKGGAAYEWGNGQTTDLTALSASGAQLLDSSSLHPGVSGSTVEETQATGAFLIEHGFKAALSLTGRSGGDRRTFSRSLSARLGGSR